MNTRRVFFYVEKWMLTVLGVLCLVSVVLTHYSWFKLPGDHVLSGIADKNGPLYARCSELLSRLLSPLLPWFFLSPNIFFVVLSLIVYQKISRRLFGDYKTLCIFLLLASFCLILSIQTVSPACCTLFLSTLSLYVLITIGDAPPLLTSLLLWVVCLGLLTNVSLCYTIPYSLVVCTCAIHQKPRTRAMLLTALLLAWGLSAHNGYLVTTSLPHTHLVSPHQKPWIGWLKTMSWGLLPAWPFAALALFFHSQHTNKRIRRLFILSWITTLFSQPVNTLSSLLYLLPSLAVLGTYGYLHTKRGTRAALHWFVLCVFPIILVLILTCFSAIVFHVPKHLAHTLQRLAPRFVYPNHYALPALLSTIGIVLWITSCFLWQKKLERPLLLLIGGIAACWIVSIQLLSPYISYSQEYRSLFHHISNQTDYDGACLAASNVPPRLVATLKYFSGMQILSNQAGKKCRYCLVYVRNYHNNLPPLHAIWSTRPSHNKAMLYIIENNPSFCAL